VGARVSVKKRDGTVCVLVGFMVSVNALTCFEEL
jgi:hypothetical protein